MGEEHNCGHRHDTLIVIHELDPNLTRLIEKLFGKVSKQLSKIQEKLNIMPTQAEFDAQVAAINTKLDDVSTKVSDEAAQVKAFIDAHPNLDTSALDGVASRLDALGTSITQIDPDDVPTVPVDPNA